MFYAGRKKLLVGTDGFQPYLIIGMIETENRRLLRKAVLEFMEDVKMINSIIRFRPSLLIKAGTFMHGETIPK